MATIGYGNGSEWQLLQYLGRRGEALAPAVQEATGVAAVRWLDAESVVDDDALEVGEQKGHVPAGEQHLGAFGGAALAGTVAAGHQRQAGAWLRG